MLTQLYGVPGIIVASLASSLLSLIYQLSIVKKKLGVDFIHGDSLKIYLRPLAGMEGE